MRLLLLSALLAQPMNMNVQPIEVRQNGVKVPTRQRQYAVNCVGGVNCTVDGGVWTLGVDAGPGGGGGGGGAPVDGGYVVWTSVGSTYERVLTAGSGVSLDTSTPGQIIVNGSGGSGLTHQEVMKRTSLGF